MSNLDRVAVSVATLGGAGYAPLAPGTVGSLITVLLLWWLSPSPVALVTAFVLVALVGIWASGRAEAQSGKKDPGSIVIDEVAGMMLSALFLPLTPGVLAVAFLLFRLFDIIKPYPARQWQDLHGGLGVMLDDLMAGVYANLIVRLCRALTGFPA